MKILIDIPEEIKHVVDKYHCYGTVADKAIWNAVKNGEIIDSAPAPAEEEQNT